MYSHHDLARLQGQSLRMQGWKSGAGPSAGRTKRRRAAFPAGSSRVDLPHQPIHLWRQAGRRFEPSGGEVRDDGRQRWFSLDEINELRCRIRINRKSLMPPRRKLPASIPSMSLGALRPEDFIRPTARSTIDIVPSCANAAFCRVRQRPAPPPQPGWTFFAAVSRFLDSLPDEAYDVIYFDCSLQSIHAVFAAGMLHIPLAPASGNTIQPQLHRPTRRRRPERRLPRGEGQSPPRPEGERHCRDSRIYPRSRPAESRDPGRE